MAQLNFGGVTETVVIRDECNRWSASGKNI